MANMLAWFTPLLVILLRTCQVMPTKPICDHSATDTLVTIECSTERVYPTVYATLHRREVELTKGDYDPFYPVVKLGRGSEGDITADVIWRIPVSKMRLVNTFYVEMTSVNSTLANTTAVISDDIVVKFSVPEVQLSKIDCPLGPRVGGKSILNGTNATCTCELSSFGSPPGFANWYNKYNTTVGISQVSSSTITVSYNSSDPDQTYECRPNTSLIANVSGVIYTPVFTGCLVIVKKGDPTNLQCNIPPTAQSVTWQLLGAAAPVNLTTCSVVNNNCTASTSSLYNGSISGPANNMTTRLDISAARLNETQFSCVTNTGVRVDPCGLEVYGCPAIVEQGLPTNLRCNFDSKVTSVTWQVLSGASPVNVTTCSFVDNTCRDLSPTLYRGYTGSSAVSKGAGLQVIRSNKQYTQFGCLSDTGVKVNACAIEVYDWPSTPSCKTNVAETYVDIICYTNSFYPAIQPVLHRLEEELSSSDLAVGYPICDNITNIFDLYTGDYKCTWRIPMDKMRPLSRFYVEMSAVVSDMSMVSKKPVYSNPVFVILGVPRVKVDPQKCPLGPGVVGISILNGTSATCLCDLTYKGNPPGYAQWYDRYNTDVGSNEVNGSSILTVSYNFADLDQTYECRPQTPLKANISVVKFTPAFTSCLVPVEQGRSTRLQCKFSSDVKHVTWQLLGGDAPVNLTTCSFANNTCSKKSSDVYSGYIANSGVTKETGLTIWSANVTETKFICVADNGQRIDPCMLEVFVPPKGLFFYHNVEKAYVEFTCTIAHYYPSMNVSINRREGAVPPDDMVYGYPFCSGRVNSDTDFSATCTWRIKMERMMLQSTFYVVMTAKITDSTLANQTAAVSDDMLVSLSVPIVNIDPNRCPVGLGVRGQAIPTWGSATCKCSLLLKGRPVGLARWFDQNNRTVGFESIFDQSSSLTVSYSDFDPHPTYECRPITALRGDIQGVKYTPIFTGSAASSTITGLQRLIIVLAAVSAWLASSTQ